VTRYSIVPDRSQVWIDARSNVHPIHSSTSGLEGFVDLDWEPSGAIDPAGTPAGRLSLAVDRLKSGNRMEDRELQKRIDARKFPRIEGQLERIAPDGSEASYRVSGEVTFRGVSRRHEDLMDISPVDERTIRLTGASSFDIRDFGMQAPKVLLLKVEIEVSGVTRIVNIGLLEDEDLRPGDWVLIHVGFAMSKIDEAEADLALASLQLMGQAYDDELDAFWRSKISSETGGT
jgi:hydrogenase expression/formation protein HypC